MAKQKQPTITKQQMKQLRTETLHQLEMGYPGIVRFQHKKSSLLKLAFVLRITLNLLAAFTQVVAAGNTYAIPSVIFSLFFAWLFYVAMTYGSWQCCLLLLIWGGSALFDSIPVILEFNQYYWWAQGIYGFEFLCSLLFLAVGCWLCFSKTNRTYSIAYAQAMKTATQRVQQEASASSTDDWMN